MSAEEHRFPCHQCGADLRFDPQAGALVCDHCGFQEEVEDNSPWDSPTREMDFNLAVAQALDAADMEETRVLTCPNCAAQVEFDPVTHARECPFCATPVVTDTGTNRHIKPRALLSFTLTEREARKAVTNWLGRLWFAPNGLQAFARNARPLQGVYVPFWTYDAQTRSRYHGEKGIDYYVTRTVTRNGKRTQVQERRTRWYPASGRVARFFDDVLVSASKSLPRADAENLGPWELAELQPYRPDFLAGFRAEAYAVPLEDGFDHARDHMDRVIRRDVRFDIGGDRQRIHSIDTEVSEVTFKHILLPVWLAAYRYRDRSYRVLVNGRSGKVSGERPWSVWKIALAVLAGLAVAGAVGYVIAISETGQTF